MAWINGFQVWLSETQSLANAQLVVDFLYTADKDWSKESISALIGNMRHESSINPNMYEYGYSESADRGFGMVQWTPRSKFWNWAISAGYDEAARRSGDSQLARIDFEVENNIQYIANGHQRRYGQGNKYDFSFAAFRSNEPNLSVNQLTEAFMWNYEGPSYTAGSGSLGERRAFAARAYSELDWSVKDPTEPIPDPTEPDPEPTPTPDPDEPDDTWGGVDIAAFVKSLNDKINKMLTVDLYKAGSSDYYKNSFIHLTKQMDNMYKVKPNVQFFEAIAKAFNDFNEEYIPEPEPDPEPDPDDPPVDPDPEPEPDPVDKLFPVRIENGINFFKRSNWGVGTLQRNMTYGVRSTGANHFGYDIGGGGYPHVIYSVTSGTVVRANYANGIGNRVTIENNYDKYFLEYGHLASITAKVGDKVAPGDPIAIMGKTGGNYAVHLDLKIATSINGFYSWDSTIDPEKYLGIDRDGHTTLSQP